MSRKFSCGRLVVNKDGSVKKLDLTCGGGIRDCTFSHIDIGFDEIHDRLRELFLLDDTNRNSKLYDFKLMELDTNKYRTFLEYIQKHGLKFKGALLYLCTPADNETNSSSSSPEKNRTTAAQSVHNSVQVVRRIPQVEADSSTSSVSNRMNNYTSVDQKPTIDPLLSNRIIENLRISSSISFTNYSFEKSLNELIDYLRNLIKQYNHESIFIQLFENICILQGLTSITLDPLKQRIQPGNEHEKQFYNEALNKIEKLSRSIKVSIELNKKKISHIDQHSTIIDSFTQFHQNFNILREQWNKNLTNTTRNVSSSARHHSNDPIPSTHRYQTTSNSRKQSRPLSSSPHRSHRVTTEEDNHNEKYSLFKNILKSLDRLSDVLHDLRFASFDHLVKSIVKEIESSRSDIKLSEYRSLNDAEKLIISVEKRLTDRLNGEYHRTSPHGIHRRLQDSFDKTLDAIKNLLNSFHHYQSQIKQNKRPRTTRWSPSRPPSTVHREHTESKPIINSKQQQQTRIDVDVDDDDDDGQSSEASHSSFGDEVLMEVARNAYEKRPNRHK